MRIRKTIFSYLLSAALAVGIIVTIPVKANATQPATANVSGTVKSGSNSSMLYLTTSSGDMVIKIDADADISGCKLLLQGSTVYVGVYRGNDAYMHACKGGGGHAMAAKA